MKPNYLWLLNYYTGECICIKLTGEEQKASEQYEDYEEFITEHLERKYNFMLSHCNWMASTDYELIKLGFQ